MKNNKTFLTILITVAITLVLSCIIVTVVPSTNHKSTATKYDLNCITKMSGRPLQDCRIESDKCLFEIDGTNTYELRPWEDCEE